MKRFVFSLVTIFAAQSAFALQLSVNCVSKDSRKDDAKFEAGDVVAVATAADGNKLVVKDYVDEDGTLKERETEYEIKGVKTGKKRFGLFGSTLEIHAIKPVLTTGISPAAVLAISGLNTVGPSLEDEEDKNDEGKRPSGKIKVYAGSNLVKKAKSKDESLTCEVNLE